MQQQRTNQLSFEFAVRQRGVKTEDSTNEQKMTRPQIVWTRNNVFYNDQNYATDNHAVGGDGGHSFRVRTDCRFGYSLVRLRPPDHAKYNVDYSSTLTFPEKACTYFLGIYGH